MFLVARAGICKTAHTVAENVNLRLFASGNAVGVGSCALVFQRQFYVCFFKSNLHFNQRGLAACKTNIRRALVKGFAYFFGRCPGI